MNKDTRGSVRVEQGAKRVRVYLAGRLVADTRRPFLVWEIPYYPTYYLPLADVQAKLEPTGNTEHSPSRGEAEILDVRVDGATAAGAARRYPDSPLESLRDLVRFTWAEMDEWLEEDEPVYTHPRDPYTRVDILASSQHVRVEIDGVTVADSVRPHILFETHLPPRYYLPLPDVRTDLLDPLRHHQPLPVQGHGRLLVGRRRPRRPPRPGLDLPHPAAGEPEGGRAWPASTTRRSTSTSTASCRTAPAPTSASSRRAR